MDNEAVVASDYDESKLDEIFFEDNGVGNSPKDKTLEELGHSLDPTLPTGAEIEFCRLLLRGTSRSDAYMQAFNRDPSDISRMGFGMAAGRLLKRPRVAKKYIELQQRVQNLAEEDLSKLISELNDAKRLASDLGQPAAMVSAIKTKASILGLEKSGSTTNNVIVDLSDDQRQQLLSRISSRLSNHTLRSNPDIIDAEVIDVE